MLYKKKMKDKNAVTSGLHYLCCWKPSRTFGKDQGFLTYLKGICFRVGCTSGYFWHVERGCICLQAICSPLGNCLISSCEESCTVGWTAHVLAGKRGPPHILHLFPNILSRAVLLCKLIHCLNISYTDCQFHTI